MTIVDPKNNMGQTPLDFAKIIAMYPEDWRLDPDDEAATLPYFAANQWEFIGQMFSFGICWNMGDYLE